MRRVLFIAGVCFLLPLCAKAQETPSVEVYGGYSFLHAETGRDLHGWNGSVAANLNKWFGLVVDVSGHYDSNSTNLVVTIPDFPTLPGLPPFAFRVKMDTKIHTIMVGPRVSYRKIEKITPFAHALFGVSRTHTEVESQSTGFESFSSDNDTTFAMAIGGGLDVNLSKSLALRVIQADYLYKRIGFERFGSDDIHHNLRASVGIVFRFGGK
jgi:opacity protein-like surface antigen